MEERPGLDAEFLFEEKGMSPSMRLTYAYLVYLCGEEESVCVSLRTVSSVLDLTQVTIWKHIQELENRGYLEVDHATGCHKNVYYPRHRWMGDLEVA